MPTSIEAQGVTVDEAVQIALNQLGVSRDSVEIEILHHPRSGFLGIGARRAKIRATVRKHFFQDGEEYDMGVGERAAPNRRGRRQSRRRRGGRSGARDGAPDDEKQQATTPARERGSGGEERAGRDRRGGDARSRQRPGKGEVAEPTEREGEGSRSRSRRRRGGGEGRERQSAGSETDRRPSQPTGPRGREAVSQVSASAADHPSAPGGAERSRAERGEPARAGIGVTPAETTAKRAAAVEAPKLTREEILRRSSAIVSELLRRMGFIAEVTADFDDTEGEVLVRVRSEAEGLLIGRRGQTLDAAEHLVNRMVFAGEPASENRIALDIGGYRDRRRDALLELAERLKDRAHSQGRRVQVSPMNPRDRRILQVALGSDDTIETRVLGSGFYRRVLICPIGLTDDSQPIDEFSDDTGSPDDAGNEPTHRGGS